MSEKAWLPFVAVLTGLTLLLALHLVRTLSMASPRAMQSSPWRLMSAPTAMPEALFQSSLNCNTEGAALDNE